MSRLIKQHRQGAPILLILSTLMICASIGLFILELINFTQDEDRISVGVTVGDVGIGGLRDFEASSRLEGAYTSPITLYYRDAPINLNPDTVGFQVNTPVMLAAARAAGETGGGFWVRFFNHMLGQDNTQTEDIPLEADYQSNELRTELEEIARIYDRPAGDAVFDLDTLTISSGDSGWQLDVDAAVNAVDAALRRPNERWVELPIAGGEQANTNLNVLEDLIIAYLDAEGFIYDGQTSVASVFILDLTTGEEINILGDVAYSAASTIKVPLLIDFFRVLEREPNQDEAFLMANSLLCSANSTSNLIMETFLGTGNLFSGIASVTNTAQYLGADNTFISAPLIDGSPDQEFGAIAAPETRPNPDFDTDPDLFNQTTAEDMGTLFSMIYDCANFGSGLLAAYTDDQFTPRECQQMLELMSANDLERLLQAGIPDGVRISHKNGWVPGQLAGATGATTADAGIVFSPNGRDYVISVYIWEETDTTGFERWPLIEGISRAAWNYFNPENPMTQPPANTPPTARECFTTDNAGNRNYQYLPPYGSVDLDNINGWRDGTPTTPQPLPGT